MSLFFPRGGVLSRRHRSSVALQKLVDTLFALLVLLLQALQLGYAPLRGRLGLVHPRGRLGVSGEVRGSTYGGRQQIQLVLKRVVTLP
jgi:hypothetical protein